MVKIQEELNKLQVMDETLKLYSQQMRNYIQHNAVLEETLEYLDICEADYVELNVGNVTMKVPKTKAIEIHENIIKKNKDKIEELEIKSNKAEKQYKKQYAIVENNMPKNQTQ